MPRPLYLVRARRIDRAGATDRLRPWSKARPQEAVGSSRPSFGKESPNSCQGLPQRNGERARIRKDGPQETKEVPRRMVPERTEAYAGVDVSKGRLEVCVRRGREAREGEHTFAHLRTPSASPTTPPAHKRFWPAS